VDEDRGTPAEMSRAKAGVGNLMGPRHGYIAILRKAADLMRGSSGGGDVI